MNCHTATLALKANWSSFISFQTSILKCTMRWVLLLSKYIDIGFAFETFVHFMHFFLNYSSRLIHNLWETYNTTKVYEKEYEKLCIFETWIQTIVQYCNNVYRLWMGTNLSKRSVVVVLLSNPKGRKPLNSFPKKIVLECVGNETTGFILKCYM